MYRSGLKDLVETELANGITLKTSPGHRFSVIGEDGEPVKKKQSELNVGDYLFVNKEPVDGISPQVFRERVDPRNDGGSRVDERRWVLNGEEFKAFLPPQERAVDKGPSFGVF